MYEVVLLNISTQSVSELAVFMQFRMSGKHQIMLTKATVILSDFISMFSHLNQLNGAIFAKYTS